VNNSRPEFSSNAFNLGAVIKKSVYQCAFIMPGCWMNNKPRFLIYYYYMLIFVQYVYIVGLGFCYNWFRRRNINADFISGFYPVAGLFNFPLNQYFSFLDEAGRERS